MDDSHISPRPSGLRPPSKISALPTYAPRVLNDLSNSDANMRSQIQPSNTSHKRSATADSMATHTFTSTPKETDIKEVNGQPALKRTTLAERVEMKSHLPAPKTSIPVSSAVQGATLTALRNPAGKSNFIGRPTHKRQNSANVTGRPPSSARPQTSTGYRSNHATQGGGRPATAQGGNFQESQGHDAWNKTNTDQRLDAMEGLWKTLVGKVDESNKDRTLVHAEIERQKTMLTTMQEIRNQQQEDNDELTSRLRQAETDLEEAEYRLAKAKRKQEDDEEDMSRRHRRELQDMQDQFERDTESLRRETEKDLEQLIKAHEQQLSEQKRDLQKDLEEKQSEAAKQVQVITSQLEAAQAAAQQAAGSLDRDIQTLRTQLFQKDAALMQKEIVIDSLRKAIVDAEDSSRKALLEQESKMRSLLTDAQSRISALESERDSIRAKASFLESDSQAQSRAFADIRREADEAIQKRKEADEKTAEYLDKLRQEETRRRKLFNQVQELKGNIRVFCRVRPPLDTPEESTAQMDYPDATEESKELVVMGPETTSALGKVSQAKNAFSFDRVFAPASPNSEIFDEISQLVQSALDGYNVCIFCYGQTGSGKTFTMSSPTDGMIPLAVHQIFTSVNELQEKGWTYSLEGSFIEVYNENLNDLLGRAEDLDKKKMTIVHDKGTTTITDVEKVPLDSAETISSLLSRAAKNRSVAATKANERSSRSHSIFILSMLGTNNVTGETSHGTLNLVDLAGSERLAHSQAEGARLKETQNINRSLSCLGDVISALGSKGDGGHVPYRNSKLTYLLQNSLGGNSKTLMMVMVSSMRDHLSETLGSLRFATKVHNTHIGTAKKSTKVRD